MNSETGFFKSQNEIIEAIDLMKLADLEPLLKVSLVTYFTEFKVHGLGKRIEEFFVDLSQNLSLMKSKLIMSR